MINDWLRRLPHNTYGQRWSINATMTLTNSDGDVYLFRRRLIQTPWVALYLHDILDADEERAPHSHPFAFASLVLRGGYVEKVYYPILGVGGSRGELGRPTLRVRQFGRMHTFPRGNGQLHRIIGVQPRTRTLVFAGRRKNSWGFWNDEHGYVQHWSEFLIEQGRNPTGSRIPDATYKETP